MNPCDHPHGGGEVVRSFRPGDLSKPALGLKTRKPEQTQQPIRARKRRKTSSGAVADAVLMQTITYPLA